MVKTLTFSMAIDIQRVEVLLPNDRRSITTKTNVNRTNKPSTNAGHLQLRVASRALRQGSRLIFVISQGGTDWKRLWKRLARVSKAPG